MQSPEGTASVPGSHDPVKQYRSVGRLQSGFACEPLLRLWSTCRSRNWLTSVDVLVAHLTGFGLRPPGGCRGRSRSTVKLWQSVSAETWPTPVLTESDCCLLPNVIDCVYILHFIFHFLRATTTAYML